MTAPAVTGHELDAIRMLIDERVGRAFALANRQKARDVFSLSLSGLGDCTRMNAYKLARTPPTDAPDGTEEQRAAMLGTWQHRGLLPKLRLLLRGARTEMRVTLAAAGLHLPGRLDLYVRRHETVVDVKTVREHGLSYVRQYGPRPGHRAQVRGYALAAIQQGKPVKFVAYVYIDRATGEHEVIVEQLTARDLMRVLDRVNEIADAARNVRMAPRDEKGPGLSVVCDGCPWLRACWGPTAVPGDSSALAETAFTGRGRRRRVDEDAASSAAALYASARAREADARADKEFARAVLASLPEGRYGRWLLGWNKPAKPKPDAAAMEKRLRELGEPVPMTGGGTRSIKVDPVPLDGDKPVFENGANK